jgi:long-chain fatty acid transport protein
MQTPSIKKKQVAQAIGALVLALGTQQALGTGFQLNEQSASSMGNAFAAGAAFTDDVSAMFWNPAALSSFSRTQVSAGVNIIVPSIKFNNNASVPAGCYPPACSPAVTQPLGNNGGDAGGYNYTPNVSMVIPINPQWAFGLGINVPFGLKTEYDDGWIGRYQGLKSKIETLNVNPAISWKITPQFAVGVGINYQQTKATLTQNINYSGLMLQAAAGPPFNIAPGSATFNAIAGLTSGLDSKATITADDWAWGWNIGLAWDATPQLRIGASYRSEIKFSPTGNVGFENPTVTVPPGTPPQLAGTIAALAGGVNSQALYGRGVNADITFPAIANVSFVYKVNQQWEVMGDVQYTGWSSIPRLAFNTTSPPGLPAVPLNWDDSYKISAGASYKVSDQWKLRFGVAYDQTPVTNDPTVRLPDSDRWWLAIGTEYKWTPNWKFDAGFVYIFADSPSFNQNQGSTPSNALVNGTYDASVWILSLQATYTF